ncbi:MAG TPA: response regulator [Flavisolibacter sp.]|nr:response regulator [Flavisolibacter sp.]
MSTGKHSILYAEDDLDDLYIVQQAFDNYEAEIELIHAKDGYQTLKYLGELHADNKLPCLIILDINMPGMNGREALVEIRQSDTFKSIPVVLFTTSSSEHDKIFAQKWGASFLTKPIIYEELRQLAKSFMSMCSHEPPAPKGEGSAQRLH